MLSPLAERLGGYTCLHLGTVLKCQYFLCELADNSLRLDQESLSWPAAENTAVNPGEISIVFKIHSQLWMLIPYDLNNLVRVNYFCGKSVQSAILSKSSIIMSTNLMEGVLNHNFCLFSHYVLI